MEYFGKKGEYRTRVVTSLLLRGAGIFLLICGGLFFLQLRQTVRKLEAAAVEKVTFTHLMFALVTEEPVKV